MTAINAVLVPCLNDNYAVLFRSEATGETLVVDAPDPKPIEAALESRGWPLTHLFVTHHHNDHTAGITALKSKYGATVVGPAEEADRIPGIDVAANERSTLSFGGEPVRVIETPGHTLGHVTYVLTGSNIACTGDTLFSLGCGRIFEGDAEGMWSGLLKLAALPDDTQIYCGHEYTLANGRFALLVEPENQDLQARMREVEQLRRDNKPTLPTTIGREKATNPFLRASSRAIRARLGLELVPDWKVFARLREMKNKS